MEHASLRTFNDSWQSHESGTVWVLARASMHHDDFLHPEGSHQREADSVVTHDDSGVANNKNAVERIVQESA